MSSKSALRLFRIGGMDVKIHLTFFLLPLAVGFIYYNAYGFLIGLRAVSLLLLVFLCVLAHEFSHGLRAKSLGIAVSDITLYPMGGVATMHRIPRQPRLEFSISIVGPLFNFALALILLPILTALFGKENMLSPSLDSWPQTLANLFWANIALGVFNLVPAFPMDGGRILRSLLARRMNFEKATRISVYLGTIFAILFGLIGLWKRHWTLILIAIFITHSAWREDHQSRHEALLKEPEA